MKRCFNLQAGTIQQAEGDPAAAPIRVYAAPDRAEREELRSTLGLDDYDLDAALDPEEIPRVEFGAQGAANIIWKRPKNVSIGAQLRFDVASVGIFVRPDAVVLVTAEGEPDFSEREFRGIHSLSDFLLKLLLHTVHHYLGHLKVIKQINAELGSKISVSMENRYYLQMLALSESLIYYVDGIEANAAVLAKLRSATHRLELNPVQTEMLHDTVLDMQQCARQAAIYSSVLSGLMDARGAIINNNVNTLLKNLTLISVIFLPLNLVASIGGMSEFSVWTAGLDWRLSYGLLVIGMALAGWLGLRLIVQLASGHGLGWNWLPWPRRLRR
ncbi:MULTISPECIES: magnesium transporter CorA family protein [unclassified Uliginosibacterium]|uniref:magnesium transporter CorA family protein n=1 Tax=unclassified Uliginosibacterium TaxID=2621521 RepID=UPI000C7BF71A|nr:MULTISPECIES: magnesium transporter CorA family protein [unclassified Uliginosibacterium]MDO6386443.1 magnesium transporter CorA family protein [Uliginosibacterium sp. 31-12]PLK50286.1 magnesium transporter [Uliginosibacterium sp. TH139]